MLKKRCSKCKKKRLRRFFRTGRKRGDGLQTYCVDCQRLYHQEHRKKHPERYVRWVAGRKKRVEEAIQKLKIKCARCPETHPAALDFHHRDAKEKVVTIANAANQLGWGVKRILEEVAKCEVLCRNCHAKHHWEERHADVA